MATAFHAGTASPAAYAHACGSSEDYSVFSAEQRRCETSTVSGRTPSLSLSLSSVQSSSVCLCVRVLISYISGNSHMAKHEMRTITGDKWDAGIWGSRAMPPSYTNTPPRAKLYFFFGEDDHWVADETRDGLIQRYGRAMNHGFEEEKDNEKEKDRWRSVMEIDQSGISHGFCLSMYKSCHSFKFHHVLFGFEVREGRKEADL